MLRNALEFILLILLFSLAAHAQDLIFMSSFECKAEPGLVQIADIDAASIFVSDLPSSHSSRPTPFYGTGFDRVITDPPSLTVSVSVAAFANGSFYPDLATTITAGSDNTPLPTGTINVADTTGFPASGTIRVATQSGFQEVACTGTSGTTFTGCTGGTGIMSMGDEVSLVIATPQGGTCSVDNDPDDNPATTFDGQVIYRARETPGTDACYVRACGECLGIEACSITRLPFDAVARPIAGDDAVTGLAGTPGTPATGSFERSTLVANDYNIEPTSFVLLDVLAPTSCGGTVTMSANQNQVEYEGPIFPAGQCETEDSFDYRVCSAITDVYAGAGAPPKCDEGTVTITINRPPVADADSVTTDEDTERSIAAAELLEGAGAGGDGTGDTDPDNDDLSIISVQSAVYGAVDLDGTTITFTPSFNFNGDATFQYTISDGRGGTDDATVTVYVNAVNDAPVLDPSKNPVLESVQEDAPQPEGSVGTLVSQLVDLAGGLDNVYDPDGLALGIAVIGSDRSNGTWYFGILDGIYEWTELGSPSQNSARTLDGSARLYFKPNANYTGPADISFRAWDMSSGTNGGSVNIVVTGGSTAYSSGVDTARVTVIGVNDPPTSTNDSLTTLEDSSVVLAVSDFGVYDDTEGTPLASVKIITLQSDGSLEWDMTGSADWQAVIENQLITEAHISAGRLRFVPDPNENGSPYATIVFRVSEDAEGTLLSSVPYTLTVNVTSVNDAPMGTDNSTASMDEDIIYNFTATDFGFSDPYDSPANNFLEVVITTLPSPGDGTLKLNNVAIEADVVIPALQIPLLTFVPEAAVNGTDLGLFTFQVRDDGGSLVGGINTDQSANSFNFDITAVNDEPTLTATATHPNFTEGGSEVYPFSSATASAVEDGTQKLTRLDLTVSQLSDTASEWLKADGTNILLINGATGTTTINGVAYYVSVANGTAMVTLTRAAGVTASTMSTLIDAIAYQNTSQDPTAGTRVVTLTRLDDDGPNPDNSASLSINSLVSVIPVNTPPEINNLAEDSLVYAAGAGPMVIDQGASAEITDTDSPDFLGGSLTVTITENYNNNPTDELGIQPGGGITISSSFLRNAGTIFAAFAIDGDTLTVSFITNVTAAVASAVLTNITYSNSDGTGLGLPRTVTFIMTDGDGGTSTPVNAYIH